MKFKLVRYFSLTSLVTILIITGLLAFFYRELAIRDLLATGERHNVALTRALANALWPKFSPFLTSTEHLNDDALRNHPKTAEIHKFLAQAVKGLSVLKIKIYDMKGRTVFSSEAKQIGENKSNNAGFLAARAGVAASEITHRDKFSAFEQVIEDRDLISSYIPVRVDGAEGPIEGVFELYYDVTELMDSMAQTQRTVIAGVVGLLALLYIVLYLIVRHADRVMKRQNDELAAANHILESLVEEVSALYAAMSPLENAGTVTEMLGSVIDRLLPATGADAALIRLRDIKNGSSIYTAQRGFPESFLEQAKNEPAGSAVETVFLSGEPIIAPDITADPRIRGTLQLQGGFLSCAFLPLKVRNEVHAIIHLASKKPGYFQEGNKHRLMAMAHQMGIAIENRQLFDEVRTAKDTLESANRKLDQQTDELRRSNAELEQFAYVASHDLQEPLRMITSYSQSLEKDNTCQLSEDAKEDLGFIIDAAKRMRRLIDDLLAYSRIGSRGNPFQSADVNALLQNSLNSLSLAIEDSNAVVTHDALPTIDCDEVQIEQLFQNLVGNAIKYRNGQAPKVHISCQRENQGWLFRVQDNGIGIDPEFADRIFVIFQRLHTAQEVSGTGIGLAVCKKIVERHNGKIWVESQPGNGSTFFFSIPA